MRKLIILLLLVILVSSCGVELGVRRGHKKCPKGTYYREKSISPLYR